MEWINIKDGQPKESKEVLIYFTDCHGNYSIERYEGFSKEWDFHQFEYTANHDQEIFWMPLPNPPEPYTAHEDYIVSDWKLADMQRKC